MAAGRSRGATCRTTWRSPISPSAATAASRRIRRHRRHLWGPYQLGKDGLLAAYENGRVFALDGGGLVTALDAARGQTLWTAQLTDESFFKTPPVTRDGIVCVEATGVGGIVYAVDEMTGKVLWKGRTFDGSEGTVAVANGLVYDAEACGQVYAFDGRSGRLVWHHCTTCSGGGGSVPTAYGGLLYVREDGVLEDNAVLDLRTGAPVATLPMPKADGALSLQGGIAYLMTFVNLSGEVRAVALDTGAVAWSRRSGASDSIRSAMPQSRTTRRRR